MLAVVFVVVMLAVLLVFVFLLLSLISSAANELIETFLRQRAAFLEKGIKEMVGGKDNVTLAFMQKIKVAEDPALTARKGAVPTRVTANLSDGQRITREVDHAPGFAARPMNRSDVEQKFRGNVGERWPKAQTEANLKALWSIEQANDIEALLKNFAVA